MNYFQFSLSLYHIVSFSIHFPFSFCCICMHVLVHVHVYTCMHVCLEIAEHMCSHVYGGWRSFPKSLGILQRVSTCTQRSPTVLSCSAIVPMRSMCPILDYNTLRLQAYDFLQKCIVLNLYPHAVQKVLYWVSCIPSLGISFSNYQLTEEMKLL